uniref:MULE transposase domain-containing protein n=1 Tax=Lactuca sativa TaxID=4236 RepID=A0A9R1WVJ7_LACSA|nr:hypothetical protein LSAT_V11C800440860 [Lactuca sativa]
MIVKKIHGDFERQYNTLRDYYVGGGGVGRKDLLGLDEVFMKVPYPGQILIIIAIYANNGAWKTNSWTWFLELLDGDLDLTSRSNFTFITNRQKHMYCLKQIHENMKLQRKGKLIKEYLWRCARSTTIPHFSNAVEELKRFNPQAHEWLENIQVKH